MKAEHVYQILEYVRCILLTAGSRLEAVKVQTTRKADKICSKNRSVPVDSVTDIENLSQGINVPRNHAPGMQMQSN